MCARSDIVDGIVTLTVTERIWNGCLGVACGVVLGPALVHVIGKEAKLPGNLMAEQMNGRHSDDQACICCSHCSGKGIVKFSRMCPGKQALESQQHASSSKSMVQF